MKKIAITLIILTLILHHKNLTPEVKEPEEPATPKIDNTLKGEKTYAYKVEIVFVNKKKVSGELIFPVVNFQIETIKNDKKQTFKLFLENMKSIEFISWHGQKKTKNGYLFKPVKSKIIQTDNKPLFSVNNINIFNRITLKDGDNNIKKYFTIFYDYRKNKKWMHSKKTAQSYPEKNPLPGTVKKIIFVKKNKSFFESIFKR